ncbi:MAG: polysaccharide biosynthesis protein [Aerococcus sp.]|nr:polysaccharide biosynthesis protein [Aerococcus sp.]
MENLNSEAADKQAQQRLNEGSTWLTIASVVSRVLGVIYIIPWMRWMGDPESATAANALFNIGYNWYSIFLMVAVAGVPAAISRQLAYYNAQRRYQTGLRLFKAASGLMIASGVIGGLILYLAAPILSVGTPTTNVNDAIQTIRSLVPALVVLPFLSILRGFFQGFQEMKSSAISQMTEQIARVAYMLVAVFLLRRVMGAPVSDAVVQSTFAAFIGAVVAILTLGFYYVRNRAEYQIPKDFVEEGEYIRTRSLLKEIILISIPFVISGAILEFLNVIDTQTFRPIMARVSSLSPEEIVNQYGIFGANVRKLVTVLVSFATAISGTLIPVIADTYTREITEKRAQGTSNKTVSLHKTSGLIEHGLALYALVMLPASFGFAVLAGPLYQVIYYQDAMGEFYLQLSCLLALAQGLYFIMMSTVQAMNKQKQGMIGVAIAVVTKLVLQYPLLWLFGTPGAILATLSAFLLPSVYYFVILNRYTSLSLDRIAERVWPAVEAVLVMLVVIIPVVYGVRHFVPVLHTIGALLLIIIIGMMGAGIYMLMVLYNHSADTLIGQEKAERMRQWLGFNR